MIHRKVLDHFGCTTERLRQIFTAEKGEDAAIRKRFEDRIMSQVTMGVEACAKNSNIWRAVDVAWDSTPIQKETVPLLLYAQGKITDTTLIEQLQKLGMSEYLTTGVAADGTACTNVNAGVTGNEMKLNLPRLYEMSINLVRSYITRRLASQTARFSNLWPYFRYEPRGQDLVSKLRGDALSERVDVMSNHYNYRHFWPQTFRHQFMYSRSVVFPRSAWDQVTSWRAKDVEAPVGQLQLESYIEREGIDFVAPHISRVYWDSSSPLANINTDNGPTHIGYWDIVRWQSVQESQGWNLDKVMVGSDFTELVAKQRGFFEQYFDPCVLTWPDVSADLSSENDRRKQFGLYAAEDKDKGCLIGQHFMKINPKKEGISDLNVDVWVRLSIAGDYTVTNGEFLCSIPACYGGLNENDDRIINPSHATELMGYQDQLSNIFSQMLMNIRAGMLQIWAIDKDALEPDMIEFIRKTLKAKDYYCEPQAFFYSGEKLRTVGVQNPADNPAAFLTIIQARIQTTINDSMKAAAAVLDMADRMQMMSPNESAQPNPREVAAREITEISSSTDALKTFVSDGIDEQRAAAKRLIYESLVCESRQEVKVQVLDRYTAKTVKDAGFTFKGEYRENEIIPLKTPIYGKVHNLVYDYFYDSRDGGDRPVNSQGAAIMGTLLGQFMQVEPIAKAMGKKRLFEWVNEIARMSGAPADLKLVMDDGELDAIGGPDATLEQRIAQLEKILQQLMPQGGGPAAQPSAPPTALPPGEAPVVPIESGTPPALAAM